MALACAVRQRRRHSKRKKKDCRGQRKRGRGRGKKISEVFLVSEGIERGTRVKGKECLYIQAF